MNHLIKEFKIFQKDDYLNKILYGDCLKIMPLIPDKSIDMILCDLPYGTTVCKWDIIIPFEQLWNQYKRICKGAIVLTGTEPFSSQLRMSNIDNFKYDWIWNKVQGVGFQIIKYRPLQQHENISVFCFDKLPYFPIMTKREKERIFSKKKYSNSDICPLRYMNVIEENYKEKYPKSIIEISNANHNNNIHPTQKPVKLFEYLIKTYTNENDIVLDNCMGSGTTAIACINTGRNYIGIEKEEKYYKLAVERINNYKKENFSSKNLKSLIEGE